jgi:hypothetical protein
LSVRKLHFATVEDPLGADSASQVYGFENPGETSMPKQVQIEVVADRILTIRGKKVLLDFELASLYEVETKQLKRAVRRNIDRFPEDFMFELNPTELENLKSHSGTSSWGGLRYAPYAFTEQGVAMLSSVLRSKKAVEVNIDIMRAFVRLRQMVVDNEALKYAIEGLERRVGKNERDIQIAIKAVQALLNPPQRTRSKKRMGFSPPESSRS